MDGWGSEGGGVGLDFCEGLGLGLSDAERTLDGYDTHNCMFRYRAFETRF